MTAQSLRLDRAIKLVDTMAPKERAEFLDAIGAVLKSPVDRAFALVEKMTDDERAELFELLEDYCLLCGEMLPEDAADHDCHADDDDSIPPESDEDDDDDEENEDDEEVPA